MHGMTTSNRMANNSIKYFRIDTELRDQKRREWNKPVLWPILAGVILLMVMLIPAANTYRRKIHGAALEARDLDDSIARSQGTS